MFARRFAYHTWATRRLAEALSDADAHAPARRTLAHVATADAVWLQRLHGDSSATDFWPPLDADAIRTLAARNADDYDAFLAGLDEAGHARRVAYRNSRGEAFETPVLDILDHVLLHGAYHRGQAAAALRSAGTAPPMTDYIVWVRSVEPLADGS